MLKLNDGRSELYQWDTGRKLTVDAECSQVHFSNKVFGRSIDVDVVDGIAIIPDIMLQTDKDLTAWAFAGTPENGYTKISKVFKVNKRNKPSDYVFTPPDQTTLGEIMERLGILEDMQDPDAIKNAVEDYLEQNPVEAPVESVNGKTGAVKLTAEDVGAISTDELPEAVTDALAQAKESGQFDGQDGYTPVKGVDYFDGQDGKDGYTPQKGIDYFDGEPGQPGKDGEDYILTDADKAEIAELTAPLVETPDVQIPTKLPNPYALTINGTSYDGSEAVDLTIEGGSGGGGSGGGSKFILLHDETIELSEPVKNLARTLQKPATGMNEFIIHILWTANENPETSGNDNLYLMIGNCQAMLGDGTGCNEVVKHLITLGDLGERVAKSQDYYEIGAIRSSGGMSSNLTNAQARWTDTENTGNWTSFSIFVFSLAYMGTITVQIYGK